MGEESGYLSRAPPLPGILSRPLLISWPPWCVCVCGVSVSGFRIHLSPSAVKAGDPNTPFQEGAHWEAATGV